MSRQKRMYEKLTEALKPICLKVENESPNHHVPEGAETHFKVLAVSQQFNGLSRVKRHKIVYELLAQELQMGLHALSLHLYSPEEWAHKSDVPASPACQNGKKHG